MVNETPAEQVITLLNGGKYTVGQLAQRVYGSYDNYTSQNIHAIIHSLRKKGYGIVSIKEGVDERKVAYTLQ